MGMTRADARTFVAATLAEALADAGLGTTDVSGALKEVIDSALLATGTSYDSLATAEVASADVIGYRAVLEYAGLKRCYDAILARVDIQLDGPQMSKSRSQAVRQMENRIRVAKDAATPYLSSGDFAVGTVTFDFLEPVEVA
mgnify:CR=1 FL=1